MDGLIYWKKSYFSPEATTAVSEVVQYSNLTSVFFVQINKHLSRIKRQNTVAAL